MPMFTSIHNLFAVITRHCFGKVSIFCSFFCRDDFISIAVSAVLNKDLSIRKAADAYNIPRETIRHVTGDSMSTKMGRPPHFDQSTELDLKTALNEFQKIGQGVSTKDFIHLGAEVCETGGFKKFKNDCPTASWVRTFKTRHKLTLRRPENISVARVANETPEMLKSFYDTLENLFNELAPRGLTGNQVFNTDESGLCMVLKSSKVIALRGSKIVRKLKSAERGENITVIATGNATGTVILPPTVIYRGKTLNEDLMKDAIEGTLFGISKRSFIDDEFYLLWFKKFIEIVPATRPLVLILDGHLSHTTRAVLKLARENDIHILIFPAHMTHLLQPFDLAVFFPLKNCFGDETDKLMRKNKLTALNR